MTQSAQRRLFDIIVAGSLLICTWPVFLVCALAVRLSGRGPILHRATRIGQYGNPFTLYKFRTMIVGAAGAGPKITAGTDSRVTSVGRLLRRSKLDELPQLWNVLRGEMSIVGPRPEDPRYVEEYTPHQRRVLEAKPGITGPASVQYRDEESILAAADDLDATYARIMADKLEIDIEYIGNRTIRSDLRLILDTVRAVLG